MPPTFPWQNQHIHQLVPLERINSFFAEQESQEEEPLESSSLVDEIAQGMTPAQSENVRQRAWYQSEMAKKRRLGMAPPAWKAAMQRNQTLTSNPSRSSSTASSHPNAMHARIANVATCPEGNEEPEGVDPMMQDSVQSDSESTGWSTWCDLQESNLYP